MGAQRTKRHLQHTFHEILDWSGASLRFRANDTEDVNAILEHGVSTETLILQSSVLQDHLNHKEP